MVEGYTDSFFCMFIEAPSSGEPQNRLSKVIKFIAIKNSSKGRTTCEKSTQSIVHSKAVQQAVLQQSITYLAILQHITVLHKGY